MKTIAHTAFTTIKTEGGILPPDLLQRIAEGHGIEGLAPEAYHLFSGERLNEAINHAWNRCLGAWRAFAAQRAALPDYDRGTTLTRERWLLVLFQELGYGRLSFKGGLALHAAADADENDAARYPISHRWGHVPIHLVTFRQPLDRRSIFDEDQAPGTSSARSKRSPHSLMQEFLNRSDAYLWGMVSNGLHLRVLRDNVSLTRAAYLEFDLDAMMTGEHYADFALLWLVCHQSRVEGDDPNEFWLERWSQQAAEQGVRALDALRDGVQEAITALGRGFLAHGANSTLRERLQSGALRKEDYYHQLLRLVYRLIFLFVAEDRDLLLVRAADNTPGDDGQGYTQHYAVSRLREMAAVLRGGPHSDRYQGLRLLFTLLREGYPPLRLPALGSFLFSAAATPDLDSAELANRALLDGIRALAFTTAGNVRRAVVYRNLGSEELGSIYESLLELHPQVNVRAGAFELESAAGSERKTTGSYYTPASLIQSLLDTALEPVIAARLAAARETSPDSDAPSPQEAALLAIKVIDPAAGSGHFLIAAAHRLAHHLARIRTRDDEPAPAALRDALRDVVRYCIHGVDCNPMAVELCKVALWMETLDPGKPLSFLDHNIQCGNSLVGVGPGMAVTEIPDDAFRPASGDDKRTAAALRKRNRRERTGQLDFFRTAATDVLTPEILARRRAQQVAALDALPEDRVQQLHKKEQAYRDYLDSDAYRRGKLVRDLWTAAFFWPISRGDADSIAAPTQRVLAALRGQHPVEEALVRRTEELAARQAFFHWEIAFPEIFSGEAAEDAAGRPAGGFDVVLGNPPWERIKLQEKEFFAQYAPEIAGARTAAVRHKLIKTLSKEDPALHRRYRAALQDSENLSNFLRNSGHYPLSAVGDINTYQVFAGLARQLVSGHGQAGIVVPTGIATDYFNREYFSAIVSSRELVSLYDFENREGLFPGVHRSYKFCLLTLGGPESPTESADFAFFLTQPEQLRDPERRFTLAAEDFQRINPNTHTCPVFRTRRDAELTRGIYRRVPVLLDEARGENPWGVSFLRMFDMSNDSALFRTRAQLEDEGYRLQGNHFIRGERIYLPLYEAKLFHQFDHRFATYETTGSTRDATAAEHENPEQLPLPRYWVMQKAVLERIPATPGWLLGFRDIARATDERTGIFSLLPWTAVGHTAPLMFLDQRNPVQNCKLIANLNALVSGAQVLSIALSET